MFTSQPALEPQVPVQMTEPPAQWGQAKLIGFRFAFAYFVFYSFPFPITWIPYTDYVIDKYSQFFDWLVPWTAKHILHIPYPVKEVFTGSGDTTFNYVFNLLQLVVAIVAVVVWSLLDRKRPNYQKLHQWFRLYIRFALLNSLIVYGSFKVIKTQFPDLRLSDLMTTYGQSTPMHLLWAFMGASKSYNLFTGGVEMLGGILLIVPRFTLLGSLVALGAMTQVFVLNMCYDVPVKLYSFHLLLMAVVLAAPDLPRLARLLVFNRPVPAANDPPLFRRKWLNYGLLGVQLAFGLYILGLNLYQGHQIYTTSGNGAPKLAIRGIWIVDEFSANGQAQPSSVSDQSRWQQAIFDDYSEVLIQSSNGWRQRYRQNVDTGKKAILIWKREDQPPQQPQLHYEMPAIDSLVLDGQFDGRTLHVKLHRIPEPNFMLTSRGFHWISEYPFNRFDEH